MASPLRVLSLNLRRDIEADGHRRWAARRDAVARLVARHAPHALATQEGLARQLADLDERLPAYERVGRDRRGDGSDEHNAIYYDPRRLLLVAWGDLWLSDTPSRPGSATWGNRLPRMVTWARFTDQETGASFTLANTHLDHESGPARARAARFLHERFPDAMVAGDFNEAPGGLVHRTLTQTRDDPLARDGRGTYHAFTGRPRDRIDWILVPPAMRAVGVATLVHAHGEAPVSDHFPVMVDVVPAAAPLAAARGV